jgi:pimeloyl-ACP methyl ester carboxylesterase
VRRLILVVVYGLLLATSHVVRWRQPSAPPPAPGQSVMMLPETLDGQRTGRDIAVAYWDIPSTSGVAPTSLPVVMLHGSPVATAAMLPLMRELQSDARVIAPDLPGMGNSTRVVADYSFVAHAHAVLDLLDRLGVARVHLAAYSMGGGVALQLAELAPGRVA